MTNIFLPKRSLRLYTDIVNDSLTEFAYDADLAGLSYNLVPHANGLFIMMSGYNDKMSVLAQHILEKVKGLVVDPQRLSVIKEQVTFSFSFPSFLNLIIHQVRLEWQNFFLGQSHSISDYYGRYLLSEQQWTVEEKLKELPCQYLNSQS